MLCAYSHSIGGRMLTSLRRQPIFNWLWAIAVIIAMAGWIWLLTEAGLTLIRWIIG